LITRDPQGGTETAEAFLIMSRTGKPVPAP
jgi:hypothetical protein